MVCEKCRVEATGTAWGWLAFREDDDGDPEPVLAFYCPRCSYYEFGEYLRYRSTRQDDKRWTRADEDD
jgi:hypothetical protein